MSPPHISPPVRCFPVDYTIRYRKIQVRPCRTGQKDRCKTKAFVIPLRKFTQATGIVEGRFLWISRKEKRSLPCWSSFGRSLRPGMDDGCLRRRIAVNGYMFLDTITVPFISETQAFNTYARQICMMLTAAPLLPNPASRHTITAKPYPPTTLTVPRRPWSFFRRSATGVSLMWTAESFPSEIMEICLPT